ncbi:MAG: response regulator transcription factor [Anaerolineales bacterium]|nr:response regulator transcription factor [Anaerolineales bacterium]
MRKISIVLVDDHAILRQGLRALLEQEPDMKIAAEAGSGPEALRLVESLRPDVVVLDLELPGINGLEVARLIHQGRSQARVVILSMFAKEAYVGEALNQGACGYVLKDSGARDLVQAIRHAIQGKLYLSPPLSEQAIEAYTQKAMAQNLDLYETLTGRERQVLPLAALGKSNAEIGEQLLISARTAEIHRARVMRKLGLKTQADLTRFAVRRGIIPIDD